MQFTSSTSRWPLCALTIKYTSYFLEGFKQLLLLPQNPQYFQRKLRKHIKTLPAGELLCNALIFLPLTSVSDWDWASLTFFSPWVLIYVSGQTPCKQVAIWSLSPSLSTFRTKWPLHGDVPTGMGVSRLVAESKPPSLQWQRHSPMNHGDAWEWICSSFN